MINVDVRHGRIELGEAVEAEIQWNVEGRQPEAVVIEVGWRTEGRGTVNSDTVWSQRAEIEGGDTFAAPWTSIRADIPDTAPISYDGELIRIRWGVHVRLDIPWAKDEKVSEEFWVGVKEV